MSSLSTVAFAFLSVWGCWSRIRARQQRF